MKKFLILFVMAAFAIAAAAGDHTQYVNPLIGTQTDDTGALSGSTFPGACWPLGLVQLSPDTEKYITWDPCSGYDYDRNRIYGSRTPTSAARAARTSSTSCSCPSRCQ